MSFFGFAMVSPKNAFVFGLTALRQDSSYHGLVFAQALGVGSAFGANLAYIFKIRLQLLRDVGAAVAPFNALSWIKTSDTHSNNE